jgi:hypothetical protein
LIEVLVALAVFGVGVSAFLPALVASGRAGDAASARTQALALAQEKASEILVLPFSSAASLGSGSEALSSGYERSWEPLAAFAPPGDEGHVKRFLVKVRWTRPYGSGEVRLVASRGRY